MSRIFEFLRSIYIVLLFLLAEGVAIIYYARSNSYTQAKMLTYTSNITGGASYLAGGVSGFFALRHENNQLLERVVELEEELANLNGELSHMVQADSLAPLPYESLGQYNCISANVVSNSINKLQNFIVIDCGTNNGVRRNMAAISPDGNMVGYVAGCSDNYAAVVSALSTDFRTSGKLVGDDYFGSIYWNGRSRYSVEMNDLSKYASIEVGDSVVSTGFSQIFPADIPIGVVESFEFNETKTAYNVVVTLHAEMSRLGKVILIDNNSYQEIDALYEGLN